MADQVLGSIVAVVVLAAVGTVVGVLVSKNNKSSSTGSSDATTSSSTSSSSGTNSSSSSTSSSDPSVFTKDTNLHKAFYGLAYTPEGSLPDTGCNSTLGRPPFQSAVSGYSDSMRQRVLSGMFRCVPLPCVPAATLADSCGPSLCHS